jgi:hypothetical protein
MDTTAEPQLAPPGAGLPKVELYVARLLFTIRRWFGNRESFTAHFGRERETIRGLLKLCDTESAATRVLISRPRGLEDSSRFWSVWMTLDHLRIVHRSMSRIIGSLSKGVSPGGKASTAAVKPNPDVTTAIVDEYERSCDELQAEVAGISELKTKSRYAHPWFGPLNAAGWHALAASHITIHRVQIERILEQLSTETIRRRVKADATERVPVDALQ